MGRLSETAIAFARSCSCGIETVIAFGGGKWAFWVRFSVAEVIVVSMVAVQGRALVMAVSMVAVQGRALVLLVSMPPSCRASCAIKFDLHARNTPKSAFDGPLGELFRGNAAGGAVRGEVFRANRPCAQVL